MDTVASIIVRTRRLCAYPIPGFAVVYIKLPFLSSRFILSKILWPMLFIVFKTKKLFKWLLHVQHNFHQKYNCYGVEIPRFQCTYFVWACQRNG